MITARDAYEEHAEARRRWLGDFWVKTWEELSADEQSEWEREADEVNRKDYEDGRV